MTHAIWFFILIAAVALAYRRAWRVERAYGYIEACFDCIEEKCCT